MDLTIYSFFKNFLNKKADKAVGQIIPVVCMDNYVPEGTLPCNGSSYSKIDFLLLWNKYLIGTVPTYYAWVSSAPALTVWTNTVTPVSYQTAPLLGHAKYADSNYVITNVGSETQITVSATIGGVTTQYTCIRQSSLDENNHLLPTCTEVEYSQYISLYGQCPLWTVDTASGTFRPPHIKDGTFLQQAMSGIELGKVYNAGLPNITGSWPEDNNTQAQNVKGAFTRGGSAGSQSATGSGGAVYIDFNAEKGRKYWESSITGITPTNTIYGNSKTVQPQAITTRFFVVV